MSAPPPGSDPPPDDDNPGDLDNENFEAGTPDDLERLGDADPSGKAASDPEKARREAEDALAEIEALADLDEDPDAEDESTSGAAASEGKADTSSPSGADEPTGAPSHSDTPEDQCENCGALLHGPYCHQCGQKSADRIVPVWHMINEALEAVFELDLRVFRTFPTFFFLPGRLTKEYINGRRKRYIRPFRLFLFSTFLLFAALALTTTGNFGVVFNPQGLARFDPPDTDLRIGGSSDTTVVEDRASSGSNSSENERSSTFAPPEERKRRAERIRSDTSVFQVDLDLYDDPEANDRLETLLRYKVAEAVENPWNAVNSMIDRGPYLMFLMLPIFAFLLKLFYIRNSRFYVEHLIFSFHIHAFAFFVFTIGLLLAQADSAWLSTAAAWIEATPLLYLVLALSHVYDQGLIKSTIKAAFLLFIYGLILLIGFLGLLFVAVLLM